MRIPVSGIFKEHREEKATHPSDYLMQMGGYLAWGHKPEG